MNLQQINKSFEKLLDKGGDGVALRKKIKMSAAQAATYRHDINTDSPISLEKKIIWLQRAEIKIADEKQFTKKDLVAVANLVIKSSKAAKEMGAEYIVEKFIGKK